MVRLLEVDLGPKSTSTEHCQPSHFSPCKYTIPRKEIPVLDAILAIPANHLDSTIAVAVILAFAAVIIWATWENTVRDYAPGLAQRINARRTQKFAAKVARKFTPAVVDQSVRQWPVIFNATFVYSDRAWCTAIQFVAFNLDCNDWPEIVRFAHQNGPRLIGYSRSVQPHSQFKVDQQRAAVILADRDRIEILVSAALNRLLPDGPLASDDPATMPAF